MPVTDREHPRPVGNRDLTEGKRRMPVALILAAISLFVAAAALIVALIALDNVGKLTSTPGVGGTTDIGTTGQ